MFVAVTKSTTPAVIRDAGPKECGVLSTAARVGRNRSGRRAEELADLPIRWHMVGSFQRNKVARTLSFLHRVHSIDSIKLLDELRAECSRQNLVTQGLIQINGSDEAQKHGINWAEAESLELGGREGFIIDGLMTMAADGDDPEAARPVFRRLRELGERLGAKELSMGMSGDYEVAVEEGATIVRVGSALFEGLE